MMAKAKRLVTACVCLVLPPPVKPLLLRLLGHKVSNGARIGFSIILVDRLVMAQGSRIGHLNLIEARRIALRPRAYIQTMNIVRGRLNLSFGENAGLGNRNKVLGDKFPPSPRPQNLRLGTWSKITSSHYVNVGESIVFGNYSTLGGAGSQLWTHGYIHMPQGPERAEVRGRITVGNNVYFGSHCCITPGVTIVDGVSVGSHASVAKSLLQAGSYVPERLRFIPATPEERISRLKMIKAPSGGREHFWVGGEDST
jgi:acetyltransferase-like isoleucine patch superfamily enzyme